MAVNSKLPFAPTPVTREGLERTSPGARARLYENARRSKDRGGQAVMDLIDASGLPLSAGGMTAQDPVYIEMQDIVWSDQGREACRGATRDGLPALAGVEPLIRERLGPRYHPHDQGTMNAGYIVGELMRHLGYDLARQGKMPDGSVAKTAAIWVPRLS